MLDGQGARVLEAEHRVLIRNNPGGGSPSKLLAYRLSQINAFDSSGYRLHTADRPTPEKIRRLHERWFEMWCWQCS